jgi:hypothetical protein
MVVPEVCDITATINPIKCVVWGLPKFSLWTREESYTVDGQTAFDFASTSATKAIALSGHHHHMVKQS